MPTLALLRVDTPPADKPAGMPASVAPDTGAIAPVPAASDQVAAIAPTPEKTVAPAVSAPANDAIRTEAPPPVAAPSSEPSPSAAASEAVPAADQSNKPAATQDKPDTTQDTKVATTEAGNTPPVASDVAPATREPVKPDAATFEPPKPEAKPDVAQPEAASVDAAKPEQVNVPAERRACNQDCEARRTGREDRRAVAGQSRSEEGGGACHGKGEGARGEEGQSTPPGGTARSCRSAACCSARGRPVRPDGVNAAGAHAVGFKRNRSGRSRRNRRPAPPVPIPTTSRHRARISQRRADRARASARPPTRRSRNLSRSAHRA